MALPEDPQNPYSTVTTNDLGAEVVQLVINWYRGNRNSLSSAQQSAVITAVTGVLNGSLKV